ncbi:MAG: ferritin-like domain-containing protein [Dehalococcoidia bacterium]
MDSTTFAKEMQSQVTDFCAAYESTLPAYSYVPLTDDGMRVKVMKNRLWNEVRAAEVLGTWLKTTPEMDVKKALAGAIYEEFEHADLLSAVLADRGESPYDTPGLPAQVAMFNAFEVLGTTVERMAAFPLAGEGVAVFMIQKSLSSESVPRWVSEPYEAIQADEQDHGSYPAQVLAKYAVTEAQQDSVRRAVAMSLTLRREYFANLDRWVYDDKPW